MQYLDKCKRILIVKGETFTQFRLQQTNVLGHHISNLQTYHVIKSSHTFIQNVLKLYPSGTLPGNSRIKLNTRIINRFEIVEA